jgi:hypothetical protein
MQQAYILVNGIELNDVETKVNDLIAQGYTAHPLVVVPPIPGAVSRPRYIVPMVHPYAKSLSSTKVTVDSVAELVHQHITDLLCG